MVLQTTAIPFGHLSKRENRLFSLSNNKRAKPEPNLNHSFGKRLRS
jgi:hypothetical protein